MINLLDSSIKPRNLIVWTVYWYWKILGVSIDWLTVLFIWVLICETELQSIWWKWVLERRVNVQSLYRKNARQCWHKCFVTKITSTALIVTPKVEYSLRLSRRRQNHWNLYFNYRSSMGIMESGYFSMYSMCWNPQELGCTHITRSVSEPRHLDSWTGCFVATNGQFASTSCFRSSITGWLSTPANRFCIGIVYSC